MVAKSISWNVGIRCKYRVHLWQLNNVPFTVLLLINWRYLSIIHMHIYNIASVFNLSLADAVYAKWLNVMYQYIRYIQGKPCYAHLSCKRIRFTIIVLHVCWYFFHILDMLEIEQCQLRTPVTLIAGLAVFDWSNIEKSIE